MASTSPNQSRILQAIRADASQPVPPSPLLNATQCAIALGLPKSSLYRMVRAGLPAFRIGQRGRGLRFDLTEVREALRAFCATEVKP
jgi:predicted DNA-binding transcriptional regulator AlpA